MQRLLATTKANFLKSYLQSYELQLIKDSATINSWGRNYFLIKICIYLKINLAFRNHIYCNLLKIWANKILQNATKSEGEGQSLSVLRFFENCNLCLSENHHFRQTCLSQDVFLRSNILFKRLKWYTKISLKWKYI